MNSADNEFDAEAADYAKQVGERLRAIRRQKQLSLQETEAISDQEFKASVLGAYERGERAISVPRLHRLATVYQVPVDQLLPRDQSDPRNDGVVLDLTRPVEAAPRKIVIDLSALDHIGGPTGEMLRRYVTMIQVQRQDFNGRILTIRRDDLRAIACIVDVPSERAIERLGQMGVLFEGRPNLTSSTLR